MNLAFSNLIHTHPATEFSFVGCAFAIVIAFFVGSFIVSFLRSKTSSNSLKKALRSVPGSMRWIAIIALVMTWSRLEGIPYLSMRLLWIVLALFVVYRIYTVVIEYKQTEVKRQKFAGKVNKTDELKKYLPKKKKKK